MTDTAFGHQVALAALFVYLLQLAKKSNWRIFAWVGDNTDAVNRTLSILAGIVTAAGVTISVQGGWTAGGGVLIQWPAAAAMANGASHAVLQIALQEGIYRKYFKQ